MPLDKQSFKGWDAKELHNNAQIAVAHFHRRCGPFGIDAAACLDVQCLFIR